MLETVRGPADLRALAPPELDALAAEIRAFLVERVSRTGGHLGPNLGVVELTIALHRVFDSPGDRILWDTGHQAYVHKLLTGRAERFDGLRQPGGLSGYPSRTESPHDVIENSHASTALAYADGLAKAGELRGDPGAVVAVVGDGALTGGLAWEGLNNLAGSTRPVIVVLNDNGRSYAPTVGGLARHLQRLRTGADSGSAFFGALGLAYVGPVDGHDVGAVEAALADARGLRRPVVVHCLTRKGCGYSPAETDEADCLHSVGVVDASTGRPAAVHTAPSWTEVFGETLVGLARRRPDLVAVTAAMLRPVGLHDLARAFPERVFDVGIAEQEAVASAAGLATGGLHPVVCVYSTFLNRAFDQVLMDVALHELPVTFVLDRAGVTGEDGPSHHGMWDLSTLGLVPGMRVAAPRDAAQLRELLAEAVAVETGPTALRFPKARVGDDIAAVERRQGLDVLHRATGAEVLLIATGTTAAAALAAAAALNASGTPVTVVDPRWVLPVSPTLCRLAAEHRLVVTVEDNVLSGGFGTAVTRALREADLDLPVRSVGLPQRFLAHGRRQDILAEHGVSADGVLATVAAALSGAAEPTGVPVLRRMEPRVMVG